MKPAMVLSVEAHFPDALSCCAENDVKTAIRELSESSMLEYVKGVVVKAELRRAQEGEK